MQSIKRKSLELLAFCTNNFTYILVGSGFLGFFLTMLFYFNFFEPRGYSFHELDFNKNDIVDSFNSSAIDSISVILKKVDSMQVEKKKLANSLQYMNSAHLPGGSRIATEVDTMAIKNSNDSITQLINNKVSSYDTSIAKLTQYISLSKAAFRKYRPGKRLKLSDSLQVDEEIAFKDTLISRLKNNDPLEVKYSFEFLMLDSANKDFPFRKTINIKSRKFSTNADFFIQYPAFGLWAITVTALISVWFVLLVIFFADMYVFKSLLERKADSTGVKLSGKQIKNYIFYSLALVFLFFGVGKITVYDKYHIIPVHLFTENYMAKFYILLAIGLIVAAIYFGGYLAMGEVLKRCTLATYQNNGDEVKIKAINEVCETANKNLTKYFNATAFSLTGVVVVTGILFTAVNNMSFFKLYYDSFKKPFLSYDTVYLFGGLYSLLILLFYLPLRLTFSQVKDKYAADAADVSSKSKSFLTSKDFWNRFKETLTISTPLLAGVIQVIIDMFTK